MVEDDGVGFDQEARQKGFGLLSMQEVTAALGGDFNLKSDQGAGTKVTVTFPLLKTAADIQEGSDD